MSASPPPLPPRQPPVQPPQEQRAEDSFGVRMLLPIGRSGLAIAAGYLGLFAFLCVPAPLALILGILAVRDISKSKLTSAPKYGMGRAVFGIVMGAVFTGVLLVHIVILVSSAFAGLSRSSSLPQR